MAIWLKDPRDVTWYQFNWDGDDETPPFLAPGETVTSHTTTVDSNLTKLADTATSTTVSIQVSGGTNATQSLTTCGIVTSAGNTYYTEKYIFITTRVS